MHDDRRKSRLDAISRRGVMAGATALLAAGALPTFAKAAEKVPDFSGVELGVAVWGGAHYKAMHAQVAPLFAKTKAKVAYTFGNPRDHLPKMLAAKGREPPFDVAILDDSVQAEAARLGLLEPLTADDVPNMRNLFPQAIPTKGYGPAKNTVCTGIGFNTKKYKELGLPRPTGWQDLFEPKIASHVAIPDLSVVMGVYTLVGLARLAGGSESNIAPGFEKLKALDVYYYYQSSSDLETKFAAGDVWAGAWVNGRAWALRKAGQPIDFVNPRIGGKVGMLGFNTGDIVKGTKVKAAAAYYINLLLEPAVQVGFAKSMFYGPTNRLAEAIIDRDDPSLVGKFPYTPADFEKMETLDWKIVNAAMPRWVETWNRTVRR